MCGADLADIQLISKYNKKVVTITDAFEKILKESNRQPNKIWVDEGSEFYNRWIKLFLQNNDIEMYSVHNEGKSVIAKRFIRILKSKIYKYMTSISKNVYIDTLDDIVMIHIIAQLKWNLLMENQTHILTLVKKFIIKIFNSKLVILLEYQNIKKMFPKFTLQIGLKKFLWLKKSKILCSGHMLLMILMERKLLERFTKTIYKKQIKKNLKSKK